MLRAGFEWTGSTSTLIKYFYAGAQRVAMKQGSTVYYLFGDHLGSTAITASSAGAKLGELRYKPWGESRYTWGTTYTNRHFTGQLDETTAIGLYFFNARLYDPLLARFTSADSIVPDPGNPQAWDRYAYGLNAPTRYTDPTGHYYYDPGCDCMVHNKENKNQHPEYLKYKNTSMGLENINKSENKPNKDTLLNDNLGGNTENPESGLSDRQQVIENEQVNPPLAVLVPIGITLTGASIIVEGAIIYTELVALPTVVVSGPATTFLELSLGAAGLAVLDANIAYWSYIYRVIEEPDIKQEVELLPPWGLGH